MAATSEVGSSMGMGQFRSKRHLNSNSTLNFVNTDFDYLFEAVDKAFRDMGMKFRDTDPCLLTRDHIAQVVKEKFGLVMTGVMKNEAMIVSRMPESAVQFPKELNTYDIHFDLKKFVSWLINNIPLMHPVG